MSEQGNVIRIADWDDEPLFAPGMTVIASVGNPLENAYCTGKFRPAVLVERVDGHWLLMGLTSKSTYDNGLPRVAVPIPIASGSEGPGICGATSSPGSTFSTSVTRSVGWIANSPSLSPTWHTCRRDTAGSCWQRR